MNTLLTLSSNGRDRLEACALKFAASKTSVVEALLLVVCNEVGENPLANYLVSRGMKPPAIDMTLTPADLAAKRPRGARVRGATKPKPAAEKGKSKPDTPSQSASGPGSHTQIIGDNNAVGAPPNPAPKPAPRFRKK